MDAEMAVELTRAAERGVEPLLEAVAEVSGWAAVLDPVVGAVAAPPTAAETARRAAAQPTAGVVVEEVCGMRLVAATPTPAAEAMVRLAGALLALRAGRAEELRRAEGRLHTTVLDLLLRGHRELAEGVVEVGRWVTVYRLAGPAERVVEEAWRQVWRGLRPWAPHAVSCVLALYRGELVVLAPAEGEGEGQVRAVLARAVGHHRMAGGVSGAVPVRMLGAGWLEAGRALEEARREAGGRLLPAAGLGARSLLRVIPSARLHSWTTALVGRLPAQVRWMLGVWLESGGSTSRTAQVLSVSRTTVRARLDEAAAVLGADLGQACVRVRLLLGLLLYDGEDEPSQPEVPVDPAVDCVLWLTDVGTARTWALTLVEPLSERRRRELTVWLEHHGRSAPAAAALGMARSTLDRHIAEAGRRLEVDLGAPRSRAEVYLALLTVQTTAPGQELPPGAPGKGEWYGRTPR